MNNRRRFIRIVPLAGAAMLSSRVAWSQAMVDEKDAQAMSLGYVSDAARVDKAKYKNYVAGSHCGACALFQGKPDAASGPCALFPGKQVSTKGWCSAFAKKA
ncbi:high-potential iron-sulfur protein [Pseudacidovorax sp. RU35E]|uniref:high-potential iron-sulfur protein n=1 Tax=Pseudacidovorax sp. RU35E TaxID=1907403 RepID=UPI0009557C94|nr:high-potential iron-sulfur protein [Pseudacidovorax sp. RU35E]SIR60390.1 High potential iron-sulfur protein [Pseudacidovorax sp. RU35E]